MRRPQAGEVLERLGVRELRKTVGPLGRPADSQVADGQDVLAAEVEHEEHVGAPPAEALDGGYLSDHLVVRKVVERRESQLPRDDPLGKVAEVAHLGPREAARPQEIFVPGEQLPWRRRPAAEERREPAVDASGGLCRELLPDDGPDERPVGVIRPSPAEFGGAERPDATDEILHDPVTATKQVPLPRDDVPTPSGPARSLTRLPHGRPPRGRRRTDCTPSRTRHTGRAA